MLGSDKFKTKLTTFKAKQDPSNLISSITSKYDGMKNKGLLVEEISFSRALRDQDCFDIYKSKSSQSERNKSALIINSKLNLTYIMGPKDSYNLKLHSCIADSKSCRPYYSSKFRSGYCGSGPSKFNDDFNFVGPNLVNTEVDFFPKKLKSNKCDLDYQYSQSSVSLSDNETIMEDINSLTGMNKYKIDKMNAHDQFDSSSKPSKYAYDNQELAVRFENSNCVPDSQNSFDDIEKSIKELQIGEKNQIISSSTKDDKSDTKKINENKHKPIYLQDNEIYLRFNKRGWICILCQNFNFESNNY